MQGMRFLVLDQEGRPVNHGNIVQKVSDEKYLLQFMRAPSSCRLVHTDEIMGYTLFPTDEALNQFIAELTKQVPPPELEIDPTPTNSPAKKKKVSKKKRNAKTKR